VSNLFGTNYLKFKSGSATVLLEYVIPEPPQADGRFIEHESIITANRNWTNKSDVDHLDISVIINLYKYADPVAKMKEVYFYNHKLIDELFYDIYRPAFAEKNGVSVKFYVANIQPMFLFDPKGYDALRITFRSQKPVDLTQSVDSTLTGEFIEDAAHEYPMDAGHETPIS
jgi:hypothetical protein